MRRVKLLVCLVARRPAATAQRNLADLRFADPWRVPTADPVVLTTNAHSNAPNPISQAPDGHFIHEIATANITS
jgi:hypothetical protein